MGGTATFANWSVDYSIPVLAGGGGLRISRALFCDMLVINQATQPFALAPYNTSLRAAPTTTHHPVRMILRKCMRMDSRQAHADPTPYENQ
jgi:hypothetical protein